MKTFLSLLLSLLPLSILSSTPKPITVQPNTDKSRYTMVDSFGREVMYRGVNLMMINWNEIDGPNRPIDSELYVNACPDNESDNWTEPPICEIDYGKINNPFEHDTSPNSQNDLAQIREYGFDLIRLGVSWSILEPEPGVVNVKYLERVEQVIEWGAHQGLDFFIDFHQDFYSSSLDGGGMDGAPPWAVLNQTINEYPKWKRAVLDKVGFAWQTVAAFKTFFDNLVSPVDTTNPKGIQERYIDTFATVVKYFNDTDAVIGFEIMNEPPPSELNVVGFSDNILYPFYRRVIQAVTGVRDGMDDCESDNVVGNDCAHPDMMIHSKKLMIVEPMAVRNQLDFSTQVSKPFTEYPSIVYAPHTYSYSFTILPLKIGGYERSLRTACWEAQKIGASVMVSEFGGGNGESGMEKLSNITAQQDEHLVSSTFWVWKENKGEGGWSVWSGIDGDDDQQQDSWRRKYLSRIRPRLISGELKEIKYDPEEGVMAMKAVGVGVGVGVGGGDDDDNGLRTEIYVPVDLGNVSDDSIVVEGAAELEGVEERGDGSRIVTVKVQQAGGEYTVKIG
ncbi:hypothetical protein TrLO_g2673 [Triparma laevis f. longispina]|uniref:Glycoside hydrolase family 5 domain-containing protein n=1 Tax=Triparma laevis f. longispina TaxID=1714387 RepID=A0A9W7APK5_9STRA|nr:hypothetical protein TrLO_g2673 [Triparma laevis f. longispina]